MDFLFNMWTVFVMPGPRCVGPLLVLVGLVMAVVRVIMCTVPECYNYGDCGDTRESRHDWSSKYS